MATGIPQRFPDRNSQTSSLGTRSENPYIALRTTTATPKHHLGKRPFHSKHPVRPSDFDRSDGTHEYTYAYDYENRLIGVNTGTSVIEYSYDHDGVRVQKVVDGVVTNYVVDKNRQYAQVLEERDANNDLIVSYVYGRDLISQHRGGEAYYVHASGHNGSTTLVTDSAQNTVARYEYEPYGDVAWSDGAGKEDNAYRFTGEQYDAETGMYYLRARYYEPGVGRFVSRDTWAGDSKRSLSLNKYLYAEGNPVVFVDPSGHSILAELTAVEGIIGILAGVATGFAALNMSGCSSCGTGKGDQGGTLIIAYSENPSIGSSEKVIGPATVNQVIPEQSKDGWTKKELKNAFGFDLEYEISSPKYRKSNIAIAIFAHGGGGIATDYSGARWNWIQSVNKSKAKSVKGIFFGICNYGYTRDGGIHVTDNFYIADGWLWENDLAVANEQILNPNANHYNVVDQFAGFFGTLNN